MLEISNSLVLGHALAEMGDTGSARRWWERASNRLEQNIGEPGFAELRPMLAEAYLALGRIDEARKELNQLVGSGYREPYLMDLATAKGAEPSPEGRS